MAARMINLQVEEEGDAVEESKWMLVTEIKARNSFQITAAWKKVKMASWG